MADRRNPDRRLNHGPRPSLVLWPGYSGRKTALPHPPTKVRAADTGTTPDHAAHSAILQVPAEAFNQEGLPKSIR